MAGPPSSAFDFLLMEGGQTRAVPFPSDSFVVGADPGCALRFPSTMVEPRHAEVLVVDGRVTLTDLTGKGLTWVNGLAIRSAEVSPGAVLRLGHVELMLGHPRRARTGHAAAHVPSSSPSLPKVDADEPQTTRSTTPFKERALGSVLEEPAGQHPVPKDSTPEVATPAGQADRQFVPGMVIDERYEIVSRIAAGGMGEVYKARHVELNKPMAIKVMRRELSQDPEFVARFKREAIATGGIGQINIVDISDFGQTDDGRFYFVMEFLDGATLARVLRKEGPQTVDRTLHVAVQVARALTAAHSLGVVHRDLKPENIMLLQKPGQRDFVKVVDFGVAKLPNPEGKSGFTILGMVVGTPQYMSPEQARAVSVDARSDIYSLGLIIHEMLAGKPTFEAETPTSLMVKQVTEAPPPLPPLDESSGGLSDLVMQMLAKAADQRPQTMEAVLLALEDLVSSRRRTSLEVATQTGTSSQRTHSNPTLATPMPQRTVVPLPSGASGSHTAPRTGVDFTEPGTAPVGAELPRRSTAEELAALAPPSRLPIILGGVALLLLGLVGGAVYFTHQGGDGGPGPTEKKLPDPVPPVTPHDPEATKPDPATPDPEATKVEPKVDTPPPASPEQVTVTLATSPKNAEVYEGEVLLGKTPLTFKRKASEPFELRFEAPGHGSVTRKFAFAKSEEVTVTLPKVAAPPRPPPGPSKAGEKPPKGENPELVDPYATPGDPKPPPKKPDLKEGVY